MLQVSRRTSSAEPSELVETDVGSEFPDDLISFFGCTTDSVPATPADATEGRVEEEFQRWLSESPISVPSVLGIWKRQLDTSNYKYLPAVAKIVFSVPTSSAQIERDFGMCGRMVTPQ